MACYTLSCISWQYGFIIVNVIPTFGNRCLSAIGGGKQWSRPAGWMQLSAEAAHGPMDNQQRQPVCTDDCPGAADENINDGGNLHK